MLTAPDWVRRLSMLQPRSAGPSKDFAVLTAGGLNTSGRSHDGYSATVVIAFFIPEL